MSFTPTDRALKESQRESLSPQVVLKVEGLPTLFGAVEILRLIRIGEPGLLIGNDWRIGGLVDQEGQEDAIQMSGTSSKIQQQIEPDKGSVSSVSSVQVALVDFNNIATQMISPGVVLADALGRTATLYMGFQNTAYPDDYIPIFSGIIDDIESGAGLVKVNIAHPEQLKRQSIFEKVDTSLTSPINNSVTSILLDSVLNLLQPYTGTPTGVQDDDLAFYVRIGDELIEYTGISGTTLTGCTRGALGTTAASHQAADAVSSFYVLEGNAIELALKVMLSGVNGFWKTGVAVTSFLAVDGADDVANAVFFRGVNLATDYGLTAGDFVTIAGAANGANNVSLKHILSVEEVDGGSYMVLSGVTLVRETDTAATISFRSQWDVLGTGLAMTPAEVDVDEHIYWLDLLLADLQLRLYLKDTVKGKDFLDKEVYTPIGAFSIPRKGRCSMGYHLGPIPRAELQVLNSSNIKNASKIKLRRTINRNFYNTIVFSVNEDALEDKFRAGYIYQDADSTGRIPVGNRVMRIESKGLRSDLDAPNQSQRIASRLLNRYRFGAEFIQGLEIFLKAGWLLEPGDIVLFDPDGLQVSNTLDGTRVKPVKPWEIVNKTIDLKTGACTLDIIDTNYDLSERYGVIAPSSILTAASTTTQLKLQDSFGALFPEEENKKWEQYEGLPVRVHSPDFTYDHEVTLEAVDQGDRHLLTVSALPSAPAAGYVVEIGDFPNTTSQQDSALYKALHVALCRSSTVASLGSPATKVFTVQAGDAADLQAGDKVRIFSADHARDSGEVVVESVAGDQVTLVDALVFSVQVGDIFYAQVFSDRSAAYRIV